MVQTDNGQAKLGRGPTNTSAYPDALRTFIWNAIVEQASDVHLQWNDVGVHVYHRVDGTVHLKRTLSRTEGRQLANQLRSAAGLTVTRTFLPLEGEITWLDDDGRRDLRLTIVPVGKGESLHIRILSSPEQQWGLSQLGLRPADQEKLDDVATAPNGLVLITGATGSGKTTTMYSLASLVNERHSTMTYSVEDPVEFRLPFAQQIEVDESHGLTMYEGLRTILRMDPDLIMVGEIRDKDSAIVASRAALSGRLVLATIHGQDAAGGIDALHYLGVPYYIIGSSLRLVVAQNLVRRLCPDCMRAREPFEEEKGTFEQFEVEVPQAVNDAIGCEQCNSYGYTGRTGIFEVVRVDSDIRQLVTSGVHQDNLHEHLRLLGIGTMVRDGLVKVAQGLTTADELFRVCGISNRNEAARVKPRYAPTIQ